MKNGYTIICPRCCQVIDDFSLADEWFCDCGESGILDRDDEDDELEGEEPKDQPSKGVK